MLTGGSRDASSMPVATVFGGFCALVVSRTAVEVQVDKDAWRGRRFQIQPAAVAACRQIPMPAPAEGIAQRRAGQAIGDLICGLSCASRYRSAFALQCRRVDRDDRSRSPSRSLRVPYGPPPAAAPKSAQRAEPQSGEADAGFGQTPTSTQTCSRDDPLNRRGEIQSNSIDRLRPQAQAGLRCRSSRCGQDMALHAARTQRGQRSNDANVLRVTVLPPDHRGRLARALRRSWPQGRHLRADSRR